MAHRVGFKADLSLVENLRFESALRRDSRHDLDDILTRLNINRLKRLPVRSLSGRTALNPWPITLKACQSRSTKIVP